MWKVEQNTVSKLKPGRQKRKKSLVLHLFARGLNKEAKMAAKTARFHFSGAENFKMADSRDSLNFCLYTLQLHMGTSRGGACVSGRGELGMKWKLNNLFLE